MLRLPFFPFLNLVAVFIVIGIGADDVFVLTDQWKQARGAGGAPAAPRGSPRASGRGLFSPLGADDAEPDEAAARPAAAAGGDAGDAGDAAAAEELRLALAMQRAGGAMAMTSASTSLAFAANLSRRAGPPAAHPLSLSRG